jgi:hypothetical protein
MEYPALVLTLSILSTVLLLGGYHSVDLSYNILLISYREHTVYFDSYVDCSAMGYCISYWDWYAKGLISMVLSQPVMLLALILATTPNKSKHHIGKSPTISQN